MAFQTKLEQVSAVRSHSLFFSPSPAMRAAYPHLQHLWDMGPTAAPYDAMHLVLLNVVWHMWKLSTGLKLMKKNRDEEYMMPKTTVGGISQELRGARRTVPPAQTRTLRNIDVHHTSLKAVDWMHLIHCSREVLLAGRIPGDYYEMFMALSRSCRKLFRPSGVIKSKPSGADFSSGSAATPRYAARGVPSGQTSSARSAAKAGIAQI